MPTMKTRSALTLAITLAAGLAVPCAATADDQPPILQIPSWQAPLLEAAPDFAPLSVHPAVNAAPWLGALLTPVDLGPIDLTPIITEDATLDALPGQPFRVGVLRSLPVPLDSRDPATGGEWTQNPDGSFTYRAMLRSPGARALGVNCSLIDLPSGATLTIAPANANTPGRRFYDKGPAGNGVLYAPVVDGDTAYLEIFIPAASVAAGAPTALVVSALDHQYRGVPDRALRELSCNIDVNCRTPLAQPWMRDCVGRMGFQSGGSSFVCTGALVDEGNASYFPAYFLTANHCISTQTVADTLTVYWFYQTSTCNGSVPSLGSVPASSGGATLLDNSPTGSGYDHALFRLTNDARSAQTFAPLGTSSTSPGIGVHHPDGSYKRFAAYNFVSDGPSCGSLPLSQFYWLRWFDGRTEGGSSGSPLFNSSGQIIGQLFGTCFFTGADLNSCTPVTNVNNIYGRVSGSIATMGPDIVVPADDAFAPNFTFATAKPLAPGSVTPLILSNFEDWYFVDIAAAITGTFRVDFSWVSTADQRLQLYSAGNTLLQSATPNSSGVATLTRSITPGRYYIRVYRDRFQGGSYTLTIPNDCGPTTVPCVDGTLDASYGAPVSTQTTATGFGDSNLGLIDYANGSELDGAYARIIGNNLFLFLPGNLESNYNKLEIFFDTVPGGQNRLLGNGANAGLFRMGAFETAPGLRFDAGFEADYYISLNGAGFVPPYALYADYATIPTTGTGTAVYLGQASVATTGILTGGDPNTLGIRASINNANTAGVTAGTGASSGAGVTTGVELMIPLASIGNPTCAVKVSAFINGEVHDFISNQSIAPLPVGTANLGEPRTVDFVAHAGDQFVTIPIATAPTITMNPASIVRCPIAAGVFTFTGSGTGTLTRSWQVESPENSGLWVTLTGNTFTEPATGLAFQHVGATSASLTMSSVTLGSHSRVIRLRGVIGNGCASVPTTPATFTYCVADFTCDGARTVDDIFVFINAFFSSNPRCDVDGLPGLTIDDLFVFINIWFNGC